MEYYSLEKSLYEIKDNKALIQRQTNRQSDRYRNSQIYESAYTYWNEDINNEIDS